MRTFFALHIELLLGPMDDTEFVRRADCVKCSFYDPARGKRRQLTRSIKASGSEEEAREFLRKKVEALTSGNDCTERCDATAAGGSDTPVKFDLELPDLSETGATCALFGSSKSGKTHLLTRNIMKDPRFDNKEVIQFIISPSLHSKTYSGISGDVIKLNGWRPDLLKLLHMIQRVTDNKYAFVLYIDDCITAKNDKGLLEAFLTLRNSKISTVMLLQSTTLMNRNARFNVNAVIGLKNNNLEASRQSMEFFFGANEPFYGRRIGDQIKMYQNMTQNHRFIYLNCLDGTMKWCEKI